MPPRSIPIGLSNGRKVCFDPKRRSEHLHVIGNTGKGKTKFLENMIREDILSGHGVCVIDPHGELYDSIVNFCAAIEADSFTKIHLIDPSLTGWCTGFNPIAHRVGERPLHRVDNAIEALSAVWADEESLKTPAIRTVLYSLFMVLSQHNKTLADAFPLTRRDDEFAMRAFLTSNLSNPILKDVWRGYEDMAAKSPKDFHAEFSGPRRRLMEILMDDQLRQMFGQVENTIDFRSAMDNNEIVLVNFSPKHIDRSRSRAIGALLVREMFHVATSRDIKYAEKHPFYMYIDECSRFLTNDVQELLAETRKFGLHAILTHQWLSQIREKSPAIYGAIMSIQNRVVFGGLSDDDATLLANELFRTEYDYEMPVELLIRPTVVGLQKTWLHSWSQGESEGDVESSGATLFESSASGASQQVDESGFPVGAITNSATAGVGSASTSSTARVSMRNSSETTAETYIPVFEERPSAVHSLDTVRHMAIARLRELPLRNAVVKGADLPSFDIYTYDTLPKIVDPKSLRSFLERVMHQSPYSLPTDQARQIIDSRLTEFKLEIDKWKNPQIADEPPDEWRG